jgi:hypothetical protein
MCHSALNRLALLVAVLAAAFASMSAAHAQRNPIIEKCGATVESQVAHNNEVVRITSSSFVNFHSASFFLPIGLLSDCVVVLFTAETVCRGTPENDVCYIQALHNGVPMSPRGKGNQVLDSESETPSAHAFAWVSRGLVEGTNTFTIQVRVGRTGTVFLIDEWTMQAQLLS